MPLRLSTSLPERVETERLVLKKPDEDQAEEVAAGIRESFPALHRWMDWARTVPTAPEARANRLKAKAEFESGEAIAYSFYRAEDDVFIGAGGFPRIDWEAGHFEIGYWCHTAHEGNGYVTEAVVALTQLAFESLRARRVEIRMSDQNARSFRVAERAGFRLERTFPDELPHPDGTPRRTRVYVKFQNTVAS